MNNVILNSEEKNSFHNNYFIKIYVTQSNNTNKVNTIITY